MVDADVPVSAKPLVYDIGMNEGRNLPYYLAKGCRVVGVEASPALSREVCERFADEIAAGDLTVLNVGIADAEGSKPFYFNATRTVLSSFVRPARLDSDWTVIDVPTTRLSKILQEHGQPYFLKIDIEGYDRLALLDLLKSELRPPYLSAEAYELDVICMLIAMGYPRFQLVNCRDIGRSVSQRHVRRMDGSTVGHEFPSHSAGPFGDDLDGRWLPAGGILAKWLTWRHFEKQGWLDVHARAPTPETATRQ